jgi:hypothetical protein
MEPLRIDNSKATTGPSGNSSRIWALLLLLPLPSILLLFLLVTSLLQFMQDLGFLTASQAGGAGEIIVLGCIIAPLYMSPFIALVGVLLAFTLWRSRRDPVIWSLALLDLAIICGGTLFVQYQNPTFFSSFISYSCHWLNICR